MRQARLLVPEPATGRPLLCGLLLAALVTQLAGCAAAAVGAGAATGAAVAYDRRTAGTFVDDEIIEWKVRKALVDDPDVRTQAHVSVTSFNNIVLLSGEAPSEALKARAAELARQVPSVRGVHNELAIAAPSSMLARSSDTVTTAKVKSALLAARTADATRVKVVTERGTVYLLGLLTRDEAEQITEVVRRVGGVQRVVRLFEYL